jgi:hypothetical protein
MASKGTEFSFRRLKRAARCPVWAVNGARLHLRFSEQGPHREVIMGLETAFFVGAFILLTALIYGSLHYHQRDRVKRKLADQTVRDRYEHNQT